MLIKIISYIITPFYILSFFGILLCFHPLLLISSFLNKKLFRTLLHLMNKCILVNIEIWSGTQFTTVRKASIPKDHPIIVVSNHQSMYDIPMLIWEFRNLEPKFISKKELARFIPSISLSLRNMGSAIIDRKNPSQALPEISKLGNLISTAKTSAFIFPEGTRSRDGILKPFKMRGLITLIEAAPNALIIPVTIDNGWKLLENNLLPIPWGEKITMTIHKPIDPKVYKNGNLLTEVENVIKSGLL